MAIGHRLTHLVEYESRFFFRNSSSRVEVVQEVSILSQLQSNEAVVLGLNNLEEADDVGMGDFLEKGNLSRQKFVQVILVHLAFVDDLDGNLNKTK